MTLDAEEERVWHRAVRVMLDCVMPYSGTVRRERAARRPDNDLEHASNFAAFKSATGRQWSDFTRDELEQIAQDAQIAKVLLQSIDDERQP